jgi:hypothetical protein
MGFIKVFLLKFSFLCLQNLRLNEFYDKEMLVVTFLMMTYETFCEGVESYDNKTFFGIILISMKV